MEPSKQEDSPAKEDNVGGGLFAIRPVKPEDLGFIIQTFIEGLYYGNKWIYGNIPKNKFWNLYRGIVDKLATANGVVAWVTCLQDDPDTIIGYLVLSPGVLHWTYVKKSFRNYGLATKMLAHVNCPTKDPVIVTHATDLNFPSKDSQGKMWPPVHPFPTNYVYKPHLMFFDGSFLLRLT